MLNCPAPLGRPCYSLGCPVHHGLAWTFVPVRPVRVSALVYPDHDIHEEELDERVHRRDGEPIFVEALRGDPGRYFVHDGRHRAIRAARRGVDIISARVIE